MTKLVVSSLLSLLLVSCGKEMETVYISEPVKVPVQVPVPVPVDATLKLTCYNKDGEITHYQDGLQTVTLTVSKNNSKHVCVIEVIEDAAQ